MKCLVLFFSVILFVRCSDNKKEYPVRYDGYYYSLMGIQTMDGIDTTVKVIHYIKFSFDSTVTSISSTATFNKIKEIFNSSDSKMSGKFKISKDSVKFETENLTGRNDYKGIIVDSNNLHLKIQSKINGRNFEYDFKFYPFEKH